MIIKTKAVSEQIVSLYTAQWKTKNCFTFLEYSLGTLATYQYVKLTYTGHAPIKTASSYIHLT